MAGREEIISALDVLLRHSPSATDIFDFFAALSGDLAPPPDPVSWAAVKRHVIKLAKGACGYCGIVCEDLQVDHIIPRSMGGPDIDGNLIAACRECNLSKGNRPPAAWARAKFAKKLDLDEEIAF